jgi:hypothetical protein
MTRTYRYLAVALVILFLAAVARFYHPGLGFTALLGLPAAHERETPEFQSVPHYEYPAWASYDGQFYVQRALDPLLQDPAVDRAMDLAPFRARRILFSWTAYIIGLGRPAWVVNAYALQNVVCWLLLAIVLLRWIPPVSARGLALWTACLFSHGLLWSVRFSLLDGPSLLLLGCALLAVERGRPLLGAAVAGISALGRETNVLAMAAQPMPRSRREWIRLVAACLLAFLPVVIWYDYLWSIYRSTTMEGTNQLVAPGTALYGMCIGLVKSVLRSGLFSGAVLTFGLVASVVVQAAYLLVRRHYRDPWWRVAFAYALLMLTLDSVLLSPHTGAVTRVLLPLTVGFNILLTREPRAARFWIWFVAGNLHLLSSPRVMPIVPWS